MSNNSTPEHFLANDWKGSIIAIISGSVDIVSSLICLIMLQIYLQKLNNVIKTLLGTIHKLHHQKFKI